jgi:hypothetical protein
VLLQQGLVLRAASKLLEAALLQATHADVKNRLHSNSNSAWIPGKSKLQMRSALVCQVNCCILSVREGQDESPR